MNKLVRLILKAAALFFAVAALACVVISFWDEIQDFFRGVSEKIQKRRDPEYDYYDEDEEESHYFVE